MTKAELITQIGYRFRTASRNFVTADEIATELNRSIDRLMTKADLDPAILSTTIAFTGDGAYALPSDFKEPVELYDRNNLQKYKLVLRSDLYEIEQSGINAYAVRGKSYIDVESIVTSATLTFSYYTNLDCYAAGGTTLQKGLSLNSDVPILQPEFHDYFVEDVSMVLFRKEKKFDDYKIAKAERDEILKDILENNQTRRETIVPVVVPYSENYS